MQAVVFDLDGTLLDSREAVYVLFEQLTREFDGQAISRAEIATAMHARTSDITRMLVQNQDVPFDSIVKRHDELYEQLHHKRVLYADAKDTLLLLRRLGYKVGMLTARPQHRLDCLDQHDLRRHIDVIITADDVPESKPHPAGLQLLLERLEVAPSGAAIVGDTVADILAGKNAGVAKTIGVTHGFGTLEALRGAGADHLVSDVASVLDVLE
ncbi:MAG TPA: HAD family hydrolase [Candidatus Saccharimonadales bacterium]|nr:HAD family hydrolase [Candidatus Saccharimonadales bacterium]